MEFSFTAKDNNEYTILFDDEGYEITIYKTGENLGSISLDLATKMMAGNTITLPI